MDSSSFLIRLGAGGDIGLEKEIWTVAEVTGSSVTGAGISGGGVAVGRELSRIVWKRTPSLSLASIAASPVLEKRADVIGFVRA